MLKEPVPHASAVASSQCPSERVAFEDGPAGATDVEPFGQSGAASCSNDAVQNLFT